MKTAKPQQSVQSPMPGSTLNPNLRQSPSNAPPIPHATGTVEPDLLQRQCHLKSGGVSASGGGGGGVAGNIRDVGGCVGSRDLGGVELRDHWIGQKCGVPALKLKPQPQFDCLVDDMFLRC